MSEQPSVQNIQQPPEAPSLVWDDSAMQTHYANVCNVMGTREEMALLFGAHQTWQQDAKEVRQAPACAARNRPEGI